MTRESVLQARVSRIRFYGALTSPLGDLFISTCNLAYDAFQHGRWDIAEVLVRFAEQIAEHTIDHEIEWDEAYFSPGWGFNP